MKKFFIRVVAIFCLIFTKQLAKANGCCYGSSIADIDSGKIIKTVESLIKNKKSDREKINAIYQWVRTNIDYDYQRYKTFGTIAFRDRSVDSTFYLKKGICSDFARLTCYMLSIAKIKCDVVNGFARYDERDFFKSPDELLHAWNAVFVDNKWLFMDPTWAGKTINNDSVDSFFLVPPEVFIFTHFPDDKKWILLKGPLTYDEFEQLPPVKNRYFDFFKTAPPPKGFYTTDKDFIVLEDLPVDSKLSEKLVVRVINVASDLFADPDFALVNQKGKSVYKVKIPEKGKFYVTIATEQKEDDGLNIEVDLISFLVERK